MKIDRAVWAQVLPRMETALELTPAERTGWLAALDLGAEAKALLRQLLAEREEIEQQDFLGALPEIDELPDGGGLDLLDLQPGGQVGAYRLIRELGRGGMSVVWLAERDDGQLQRQVALKIPHVGPGQALLAERLRRECRILAALEHPHIARLYDVGQAAPGVPFLVLEYVEGESLCDYCNARRLPVAERLQLFLQVLRAVQHAHSLLVLHRDIKPSNILVNGAGEVKLLDFGIAKLLKDEQAPATQLTRHHGRALTPDYAAPEQIAGEPVSIAADVYALGVVLFELLTCQRPYRLPRGTAAELEEAILTVEPRRPSELWGATGAETFSTTPRRLRAALRGDLDVIVHTALQKRPRQRYATADAFAQDIRRHLANQPILSPVGSRWYRARKFFARHALAVGIATAIVAALGGGLGLALWQAREIRLEAAKANAIKDFLLSLFENNNLEQRDTLQKRRQSVQQLLEQSATALQTGLTDQPKVRAELHGVVGRLLHDLALNDGAVALRRQRVELLESTGAPLAEQVQALRELADSLAQRGEAKAAADALRQARIRCAPVAENPPVACLMAQLAQGQQAADAHALEAASADIEPAAKAVLQRVPRSAEAAEALTALGGLRGIQNRPEEALAHYRQAMAIRETLWGPHSARLARERYAIANNLWAERRLVQAEQELRLAWESFTQSLGRDHVTTALAELQLGRLRAWVRGEGQAEVQHAIEVISKHAGEISEDRAFEARMAQAETLLFDGRFKAAGEALTIAEAMPHSSGEIANGADLMHAFYLQAVGRYDEARARLGEVRGRLAKQFGEAHPYVADIDDRLAGVDLAEGRLIRAEAAFEKALQSQDAREDAFGSIKHQAASGRAVVDMERGRFDRAWPVIQANYAAARKTPRDEQYRTSFSNQHDQMGRVLTGLGRAAEALPHFEQAIAAWQGGYAHNPELAATRARYALCLLALNETAAARRQIALAEAALRAEPQAGPHFHRVVAQARARLPATVARATP